MKNKQLNWFFGVALMILLNTCANPFLSDRDAPPDAPPAKPVYTIDLNVSGKKGNDNVTAAIKNDTNGIAIITIEYTLDSTAAHNRLLLSVGPKKSDTVNEPESGSKQFAVGRDDADAKNIVTVTAVFTHSDGDSPSDYAVIFDVTGNVTGDSVTASPVSGPDGTPVTIGYTLDNTGIYNRLVFSGTAAAITEVDDPGPGTRPYTINAADAVDGKITINAVFSHSNLKLDTITFANSQNEQKIYGSGSFTRAITNTGEGTGAITYSSGDTTVATVDSTSGQVNILKVGNTVITAVKASDGTYEEARAVYELTVSPLQLTVGNPDVTTTKQYDGNANAAITGDVTPDNPVDGDTVDVTAAATYDNANAGTGKTITVVYTVTGADASNYIKPADYTITTGSIIKAPGAEVSAPAATARYNGVTVQAVTLSPSATGQIAEYAIAKTASPVPPDGWQDGLSFGGLSPETDYYVFARSKESANYEAGEDKVSTVIRTPEYVGITIPKDPYRSHWVDFEGESIGKTYNATKGDNEVEKAEVVNDPKNAGEQSLQLTTGGNGWNQAPIIPISLPYALENYQSFFFRIIVANNDYPDLSAHDRRVTVYTSENAGTFVPHGFGNTGEEAGGDGTNFKTYLLGETEYIDFNDRFYKDDWTAFEFRLIGPEAAVGTNVPSSAKNFQLAIGINCNGAEYFLDDITFLLKDDFVGISPESATFAEGSAPADGIKVTISNELSGITGGSISGTDYSVNVNEVTLSKAYLDGLPEGATMLTFAFNGTAVTQNFEITVNEAGGGGTIYLFDTDLPAGYPQYLGSGVTATRVNLGTDSSPDWVLQVETTGNNQNFGVILPFDLGGKTLSDFSGLKVEIKGVTGDISYKDFRAAVAAQDQVPTGWGTPLGNNIGNLVNGTSWVTGTITISTAAAVANLTGTVPILFGLGQSNPVTYQIRFLELVEK